MDIDDDEDGNISQNGGDKLEGYGDDDSIFHKVPSKGGCAIDGPGPLER